MTNILPHPRPATEQPTASADRIVYAIDGAATLGLSAEDMASVTAVAEQAAMRAMLDILERRDEDAAEERRERVPRGGRPAGGWPEPAPYVDTLRKRLAFSASLAVVVVGGPAFWGGLVWWLS